MKVSVSLDGPPGANDLHRRSHRGRSTAAAVLKGIELLRARPEVFGGLLAVVDLATDPVEVHRYLAALEPPVIDFNLPHATHDRPPPRPNGGEADYGAWLSQVYDDWTGRKSHHTVRMFEDIIALSMGAHNSVETLGLAPPGIVVVESDGSIESVDTLRVAAPGESALGLNISDNDFDEVVAHPRIQLRNDGREALAAECQGCKIVRVCGGGYLPHRFSLALGYLNPSVYCEDLKYVIRHVQTSLASVTGGFDGS